MIYQSKEATHNIILIIEQEQNEKQNINDTRGGRNFTHDNGWHGRG
jgi:hypothetical protein